MSDSNADDDIRTESLRKALNELLTEDDRWRLAMPKHPTEDDEEEERVCINAILDYYWDTGLQAAGVLVHPVEDAFGRLPDCVLLTLDAQALVQDDQAGLPLELNIGIPHKKAAILGLALIDIAVARDPSLLAGCFPFMRTLEELAQEFRTHREKMGIPEPRGCRWEGGVWRFPETAPSEKDVGE